MNNNQPGASKFIALFWILLAYIACVGAALAYLKLSVFEPYRSGLLLLDTFIADVIATIIIFIFSRLFRNSSFYDAYWSVIPPLVFHFWLFESGKAWSGPLVLALGVVVWYWAIRLTWNWAKHWSGLDHEDWRYAMLREKNPRMALFTDFFGIHFFPTVQVFLGMLPMYGCLLLSEGYSPALMWLAFAVGISAATLQLVSDRQLHNFIKTRQQGEIIHRGLWAWSRHPNYFGELLFWLSLALFGLAAYPQGWWWQIVGFLAMVLMFRFASIPMMEERSLQRRPNYQAIIDSTSMLLPLPPKH